MFELDLVPRLEINSMDTPNGRFYTDLEGNRFPSVTTFLDKVSDKSGLDNWKKAVGEKEAWLATRRGASRGTSLHNVCEKYILNEELPKMMPITQMLFSQVKEVIDKRLSKVIAIETPLISKRLRLGGRLDLAGLFDGKKSIIDFKTTNWAKDMNMLENYFIQESIYSAMLLECYHINAEQLVTISAGESERTAQVVIQQRDEWLPKAIKLIRKFNELR